MKSLIYLILFQFICGLSYSQNNTENVFKYRCESAKVIYKEPNGFHFDTSTCSFFSYTPTKYIYPLDGEILNEDSSICIGFHEIKVFHKLDTSKLLQRMYPGRKSNTEYKLPIRHKADTINHKINYYSSEKSQSLFNATIAGDYYMMDFEKPYKGRYYRCRIVFMHKENIGDAEIYYFYNKKDTRKITKMIENAYKMLHF
ncbi:hypothetical protein [Arachidicoccus terrestris]|uniref:hypothetical protein n=1 Tax=Arachidicoccus terrestris TaxID=2875539 RepID=UPI001CC40EDE|nr:hypothetical protein [Arachidicoccus terrestris]UAY53853.1 hypothetical protein K9M52_10200 [Arachidicoccus terrestris]